MSLPTQGDVHVNAPLTDLSVQYAQSLDKFGADKLAPIHPSDKQSNVLFKFTKDYWGRDSMKERGPGTAAAEAGYGVDSSTSFTCIPYALKKPIADQVRANEDAPLNSDRNAMQFLVLMERIKREKAFVTAAMSSGTWTTTKTGVASGVSTNQFLQWNDAASTPIEDIRGWCTEIELLTMGAARPNVLGLGQQVWDKLADHPDLIDRLKYGGQLQGSMAKVTPQMVAALLGLEEIVVMGAVENTATEGATASAAYIAGKKAVLLYRNNAPGIESVTGVKTFTWSRYIGNPMGWRIKTYRDESRESDMVEIQSAFTHKLIAADAGVYIPSAVA
jgi:hypothetical protein